MLFAKGNLEPSKAQLVKLQVSATTDFTERAPKEFFQPTLDMMLYGEEHTEFETPVLIKGKNVYPHTDPWCGRRPEPIERRNLFWLAKYPRDRYLEFYYGNDSCRMTGGDWVIFDDSIVHSLISKYTWYGMILELRNAFMKEIEGVLLEHHYTRDHTKFFCPTSYKNDSTAI
jgi:hypothetical protein